MVQDTAILNDNGRSMESRIWSVDRPHFQSLWTTPNPYFKVTPIIQD